MGCRGGEALLVILLLGICFCEKPEAHLVVGYYKEKCPKAESIIREAIKEELKGDIGISADFVRMHFHDCFVRGCDGSILINSTKSNTAEKDSPINNPSMEGFDVIDKIKSKLEAACKGVVSCADIIAFAARDSINLVGGSFYEIPSGRRDGRVSRSSETISNIPAPTMDLQELTKLFASKGLTQEEMVTLSGAHTIGVSHCTSFDHRLYKFSSSAGEDPSLDPTYAKKLKKQCPGGSVDANITVNLDPVTPNAFDINYYKNLLSHRVLFTSDQTLLSTDKTAAQVKTYSKNSALFSKEFAVAMVKMGTLDVLTGNHGEVRLNCAVVN